MRRTAAIILCVGAMALAQSSSGGDQKCTRYFDLKLNTVLETCTPIPPAPPPLAGAKPLSATSPELTFPAGVKVALVEKVIDARTLQVRYDYQMHYIRMADVVLPPKGTASYRIALNLLTSLAPTGSSIYFEDTGTRDEERIDARPVELGYFWQLRNQVNLLAIEFGGAKFSDNPDSAYFEALYKGQEWAKEKKIGVWSPPK